MLDERCVVVGRRLLIGYGAATITCLAGLLFVAGLG